MTPSYRAGLAADHPAGLPGSRVYRPPPRALTRLEHSPPERKAMHPVKLIGRATGTAVHTIRHPISSAAYAAGLARGLAGAAVHGTLVKRHDPAAGSPAESDESTEAES